MSGYNEKEKERFQNLFPVNASVCLFILGNHPADLYMASHHPLKIIYNIKAD